WNSNGKVTMDSPVTSRCFLTILDHPGRTLRELVFGHFCVTRWSLLKAIPLYRASITAKDCVPSEKGKGCRNSP
ncbi:MAG TPA: hypothetical protein VGQ53_08750, partial [Chitinophagaceae bacterium]|nr:hypothetical protein [Chitinophagaceae bacterium]